MPKCFIFSVAVIGLIAIVAPISSYAQNLVLTVERDTGAVSITNSVTTVGDVGIYEIRSDLGSLDSGGWVPLANGDSSWRVVGTPSSNKLTEVKETGSVAVSQGSPIGLGSPFDSGPAKLAAGFGVDVEDLAFRYFNPVLDQVIESAVQYVGEKIYNNLVLNIDPATGQANIENESPFDIDLTGYTVKSALGELNPTWAGIRDGDATNWVEAGISAATVLSELNQNPTTAPLQVTAGSTVTLGTLYTGDGTNQDVTFNFILAGSQAQISSVVKYTSLSLPGDADLDNDVEGDDFLTFQRSGPGQISNWQANYGNGTSGIASLNSVPEPNSLILAFLGSSLLITRLRSPAA